MNQIEQEIVDALFDYIAGFPTLHADFGKFVANGQFVLRRSTRQSAVMGRNLDLASERIVLGAFLPMADFRIVEHLLADQNSASLDLVGRAEIETLLDKIRAHRHVGQVWSEDTSECVLPLRHVTGEDSAALLSLRMTTTKNLNEFYSIIRFLTDLLGLDEPSA